MRFALPMLFECEDCMTNHNPLNADVYAIGSYAQRRCREIVDVLARVRSKIGPIVRIRNIGVLIHSRQRRVRRSGEGDRSSWQVTDGVAQLGQNKFDRNDSPFCRKNARAIRIDRMLNRRSVHWGEKNSLRYIATDSSGCNLAIVVHVDGIK